MSLLAPNYKPLVVTDEDMVIASLAWGFTLGFGWLTIWTAIRQTWKAYQRNGKRVFHNVYIRMVWGEILVCLAFSIICWLHLRGQIPPSFAFYFIILTLWALQVHFLLQIIINRCSLLLFDTRSAWKLKVGVAVLITAVNISVYCIWLPSRLQISQRYIDINDWWDRCEKVIYLLVDGSLNIYFTRIVQSNLVSYGLEKYRSLTRFNMFIIGFSLSMDVLIICMMSLSNTFVYMQFHPLAYMVKLNIEMAMADLIIKIARNKRRNSCVESQCLAPENSFTHRNSWCFCPGGSKMAAARASMLGLVPGGTNQTTVTSGFSSDNSHMLGVLYPEAAVTRRGTAPIAEDTKGIRTTNVFGVEYDTASASSTSHDPELRRLPTD
ncbi:hypothetical protein F5Y15DRAFT_425629 [Xylariaceae sp. FL0016]|nr:hypothetical protein F5Y15DRAFT_425629 [Xylariaceae sp. FL0016]